MNLFKEDVDTLTKSDLLTELIYVRIENIRLKEELQKEKKEALVAGFKDIVVMLGLLIWIITLLW